MAGLPFPGADKPRFATPIRLSIGERVSRGGKTFPARCDHFRVTRPSADDGSKWVLDEALQRALVAVAGEGSGVFPVGRRLPQVPLRPAGLRSLLHLIHLRSGLYFSQRPSLSTHSASPSRSRCQAGMRGLPSALR